MLEGAMLDTVFRKLGSELSATSRDRLREILGRHKHLRPQEDLQRQGETRPAAHFVLEGILCRYTLCGDKRAVLAYLLPGDFCGPLPDFEGLTDHGISALTPATVAEVPQLVLQECLDRSPELAKALSALFLMEIRIQRQWLANMTMPADKRMAHLLCELRARLAEVGLADARGFTLPLTQQDLAEALGISAVHANRTLQHLKDKGLARITDRHVVIADLAQLQQFAEFDDGYLALRPTASPVELQAPVI
jgi:CRP-like cAMP-binding protein